MCFLSHLLLTHFLLILFLLRHSPSLPLSPPNFSLADTFSDTITLKMDKNKMDPEEQNKMLEDGLYSCVASNTLTPESSKSRVLTFPIYQPAPRALQRNPQARLRSTFRNPSHRQGLQAAKLTASVEGDARGLRQDVLRQRICV